MASGPRAIALVTPPRARRVLHISDSTTWKSFRPRYSQSTFQNPYITPLTYLSFTANGTRKIPHTPPTNPPPLVSLITPKHYATDMTGQIYNSPPNERTAAVAKPSRSVSAAI